MTDTELMEEIAKHWARPLAMGYLPSKYQAHLAGGRLIALSRAPKPGIRPICIRDSLHRLVARGLLNQAKHHFQKFFQSSLPNVIQFGGNVKNGATNMYPLLQSVLPDGETATPANQ